MPNKVYNGQNEIKLVNVKMAPTATKIYPNVPVTFPVKNKTNKTAAIINLITRSAPPIFFFINSFLSLVKYKQKN